MELKCNFLRFLSLSFWVSQNPKDFSFSGRILCSTWAKFINTKHPQEIQAIPEFRCQSGQNRFAMGFSEHKDGPCKTPDIDRLISQWTTTRNEGIFARVDVWTKAVWPLLGWGSESALRSLRSSWLRSSQATVVKMIQTSSNIYIYIIYIYITLINSDAPLVSARREILCGKLRPVLISPPVRGTAHLSGHLLRYKTVERLRASHRDDVIKIGEFLLVLIALWPLWIDSTGSIRESS